jgi:catechol 2,3-dioxygenase-like lactoylglutathione lyase family enzyme
VMAGDPDGTALELVEGAPARVAFVAIACADLEQSLAFYRSLGFRDVARFPSTSENGAHLRIDGPVVMEEVMLRPPTKSETSVMLVGFSKPSAVRALPRPANSIGMWRAALLVDNLDTAYAELGELGITTLSPPTAMAMGPGLPELRFLCFAGPDGEVLELIEQPSA